MNINRIINPDKYFVEVDRVTKNEEILENNIRFSLDTDTPKYGSEVSGKFVIEGWAADLSGVKGSKIDFVLVYLNGKPGEGGKYLSRCRYGIERKDIKNTFGDDYLYSGFRCEFDSNDFRKGLNKFYVYFHSTEFGWKYAELELIIYN